MIGKSVKLDRVSAMGLNRIVIVTLRTLNTFTIAVWYSQVGEKQLI